MMWRLTFSRISYLVPFFSFPVTSSLVQVLDLRCLQSWVFVSMRHIAVDKRDIHVLDVFCMVITYSKGKDQPGKVANPARGQLNRESSFAPENLVSPDGFGSPVPHQPAHLYVQAESGAY